MGGPLIGISAATERVSWGAWRDIQVDMAPHNYARAVREAGGIAVVLPPDEGLVADPGPLLDRLDGLMLAGGADIDPGAYGAEPHPETRRTWPERDRFEIALARAALERDMPLLGICRGLEVLNVACGGTLSQHLPDLVGTERHRPVQGQFVKHDVKLEPGSLAARVVGAERTEAVSHHHQGIGELGDGLVATGWADDDVIEAIEIPARDFAVAVLWHPEEDIQSRVVGALVDVARKTAAGRAEKVG